MAPPPTLWPDHPQEIIITNNATSTQMFGVLYITLTGLVDSTVPNFGPWSLLGQSLSCHQVHSHPMVGITLWPGGPSACVKQHSYQQLASHHCTVLVDVPPTIYSKEMGGENTHHYD
ncbi:hypothetical protein DSO57_1010660 [Entomophthora muscae]|uniref:Uncharacterized protein n=1 Tax=Entomophthora muscae TaxID=34485 RepID=A0ACC2RXG2_9FUNG|nr:hypothetical protein DSO57_1010660 [Entomophthora muscae]